MLLRKFYLLSLALCLMFNAANTLAEDFVPKVSVVGYAKAEVAPDEMNWQLSIQSKNKNLEALASSHAIVSSKVLSTLKKLGIEEKSLKTSQMSFAEDWDYVNGNRLKRGYQADTSVSFILKDFSKYLDIWKSLSAYNEVSINYANFSYSKTIEKENEIKNQALINAEKRANEMAKALGVELGKAIFISDVGRATGNVLIDRNRELGNFSLEGAASGQAPIAPGQIKIESNVIVEFRILN